MGVMGTEHHTSNMTDVSNNTIESNQRLHKNEHWKARQPHLGRTFSTRCKPIVLYDRSERSRQTHLKGWCRWKLYFYQQDIAKRNAKTTIATNQPIVLSISEGGVFTPHEPKLEVTKRNRNHCV